MSTRVLVLGTDVSETVQSVGTVTQQAGEFGQVVICPAPTLIGSPSFWSQMYGLSPLRGLTPPFTLPVEITQGGVTIFSGTILAPATDGEERSTTVTMQSVIQKILTGSVTYSSPDEGENPAQALINLCTAFSLPFDTASMANASAFYDDNALLVRLRLRGDQNLASVFDALAEVGVARIYESQGSIRMEPWQVKTTTDFTPLFTLTDDETELLTPLWSRPSDSLLEKDSISGYSVQWEGDPGGTQAVLSPTNGRSRTVSAGPDALVTITTRAGADFVGLQWMSYLNRVQSRVECVVPTALAASIGLGWSFAIEYSEWADTAYLDVVSINSATVPESRITGVTW